MTYGSVCPVLSRSLHGESEYIWVCSVIVNIIISKMLSVSNNSVIQRGIILFKYHTVHDSIKSITR